MSTRPPDASIADSNLSVAWARAFLTSMRRSHAEIAPLVLTVGDFADLQGLEHPEIRKALDDALSAHDRYSCAESALTIFPHKHWKRSSAEKRAELFKWYLRAFLPRLKARDPRNVHGTYFERMAGFQAIRREKKGQAPVVVNQLEHIISDWHRKRTRPKRPRQSALQVGIFDPARDHTGSALSGFPCLQQISFSYDDEGGLAISAYYPTQYMFDRAYGNYLGLIHLGEFMAHELGLKLVRLNCFVIRPELSELAKKDLRSLESQICSILTAAGKSVSAGTGG